MNREIKFRAWDKGTGGMYNPEIVQAWSFDTLQWHQFDFMQFTGLKDKNGKEIYEGDIVTTRFGPRKVYWDELRAGYCYTQPTMISTSQLEEQSFFLFNLDCEVIGNIYENSELLTQTNSL